MWTFLDLVDEHGVNVIRDWLANEVAQAHQAKVGARLEARIDHLSKVPIQDWKRPQVARLAGPEWDEIWEIRFKVRDVQYRPLLFFGPEEREVTLLMGAIERGGRILPREAPTTTRDRKALALGGGHVTRH